LTAAPAGDHPRWQARNPEPQRGGGSDAPNASIHPGAAVSGGACEDRVAPHPPPPNADYALTLAAESADIVRTAREAGSTDEFFALVHNWVPGFAGLMLEDGVPTVMLVDLDRAALAESVLTPFLADRGDAGRGFQVRPARFAWNELYDWRLKAKALLGLEEMTALGISVPRNRIFVGLMPGAATDTARARLKALGVDLEAIEFAEAEPVPRLSSLDDRFRPVLGGLQITRSGINEACSAGFNVLWDDTVRAMVTAVHCMSNENHGSPQGTTSASRLAAVSSGRRSLELQFTVH
jgi:hypothetical protein